jgi:hypothetical protein
VSKSIQLTRGQVAIVDDEDYEHLSTISWRAVPKSAQSCEYYAHQTPLGLMHRYLLKPADLKTEVDHIDGNGLNNQRSNLRLASKSQNQHNRRKSSNNTSGYKCVSWHSRDRVWQAYITVDSKRRYLGRFNTAEEAYAVYCEAAERLHKEFARTK